MPSSVVARHPLTDTYRTERTGLLALGRTLTDEQAATMTTACPEWSIKDVYAHLAGIATNIVEGNTEGAATEAWADGHVADRQDRAVTEVLDEWQSAGEQVSGVMEDAGDFFPFQLFVDQWTHGWDIRATIGEPAASVPDLAVYEHYFDQFVDLIAERTPAGLAQLGLLVGDRSVTIGDGEPVGTLALDLFEYARVSMGRRSLAQLTALPWPDGVEDPSPYIDALVVWSVNTQDVIDPIR